MNREESEWRNRMTFDETFSQTPIIRKLVKSNDVVVIDSIYLHHIPDREWIGPFVRLNLDTALFQGFDVGLLRARMCGGKTGRGHRSDLQRSSQNDRCVSPTRTKQSFGAFVDPLKDERWDLQVRGGLGFRRCLRRVRLRSWMSADAGSRSEGVGQLLSNRARGRNQHAGQVYGQACDVSAGCRNIIAVLQSRRVS